MFDPNRAIRVRTLRKCLVIKLSKLNRQAIIVGLMSRLYKLHKFYGILIVVFVVAQYVFFFQQHTYINACIINNCLVEK